LDFYSECCVKGEVEGDCLNVCNGANPPKVPTHKYMNCKQYEFINTCNQKAAEEADNEKTLQSKSEAEMIKSFSQKHVVGNHANVKHLVVQQV
jgi:hypothetical protein